MPSETDSWTCPPPWLARRAPQLAYKRRCPPPWQPNTARPMPASLPTHRCPRRRIRTQALHAPPRGRYRRCWPRFSSLRVSPRRFVFGCLPGVLREVRTCCNTHRPDKSPADMVWVCADAMCNARRTEACNDSTLLVSFQSTMAKQNSNMSKSSLAGSYSASNAFDQASMRQREVRRTSSANAGSHKSRKICASHD